MEQAVRLLFGVSAVAMSVLACGPAPYVEDARAAQEAEPQAEPAAVAVVVQCPSPACAQAPAPAPAPPPPVVVAPAPAPQADPLVAAAFQRRMHKFVKCYRKGLRHHPGLAGTVVVELEIDEDGDVDEVRGQGSTLPDEDVVECVLDEAEELEFKHIARTRVVYPIHFHPGMQGG